MLRLLKRRIHKVIQKFLEILFFVFMGVIFFGIVSLMYALELLEMVFR